MPAANAEGQGFWQKLGQALQKRDNKTAAAILGIEALKHFDFRFGGDFSYGQTSSQDAPQFAGAHAQASVFLWILGVDGILGFGPYPTHRASVNLLLFGPNLQASNLLLSGGLVFDGNSSSRNPFAGSEITLHFSRWLGMLASYRYVQAPAHRVEAGPFLDVGLLRIYSKLYYERSGAARSAGITTGLGLFF